jgi:hypothetical protein
MGVCYIVALPFTLKTYLIAKEELWETQIFHHNKNVIFKKSSKETKILQDIIITLL